jgi:hypothetical protein
MRWAGYVARMEKSRGAILRVLAGKPERKKHSEVLGVDGNNIKVYFQEVRWGMDWIDLAQSRDRWRAFVNAVMKLRVP